MGDSSLDILKRIKENLEKEELALEKENWGEIERLIKSNHTLFKKIEKIRIQKPEEEKLLKEVFELGKRVEDSLKEKTELLKKKIAVTQNIRKNLDNFFTQTENIPLFVDEKE